MMSLFKQDIAWAAGLLDGAGCIFISEIRIDGESFRKLSVTVTLDNPKALFEMVDLFGGEVIQEIDSEWTIRGQDALRFLGQVQPYSIAKAEQIGLVTSFMHGEELPSKEELMALQNKHDQGVVL